MKYIIVETPAGEAPILFPREFAHRYVAEALRPMTVVAAGFVAVGDDGLVCGGASTGLKLSARPQRDTALLASALRG